MSGIATIKLVRAFVSFACRLLARQSSGVSESRLLLLHVYMPSNRLIEILVTRPAVDNPIDHVLL